jgi:hypothetical protein
VGGAGRGGVFPIHLIKPFGEGLEEDRSPRATVLTLLLTKGMQNIASKMLNVDHML